MSNLTNINLNNVNLNTTISDINEIREGAALGTTSFQIKGIIENTTDIDNLEPGIYTINCINPKFPSTDVEYYGVLIQFQTIYKPQMIVGGKSSEENVYIRRYKTTAKEWLSWEKLNYQWGEVDSPGIVGVSPGCGLALDTSGNLYALVKSPTDYDNNMDQLFVGKGTLNNVLYDRVMYHKGDTITIPSGMQLLGQKTGTAYIDLQVPVIVAPDVTSATVTGSFRAARYGGYIMHKASTKTATIATTSLSSTEVSLQGDGRNGLMLRFTAASNWYVQNSTGTVANGSIICGRSYGLTITLS